MRLKLGHRTASGVFDKKIKLHCVLMNQNLLSLVPCLPGKMLNNNPQTHSAGRNDFRNACPQRNSLKMTAHESTLQRAKRERGRLFKLTCEIRHKEANQSDSRMKVKHPAETKS